MKLLGLFYTHNQIKDEVLAASAKSVQKAHEYANIGAVEKKVTLAATSWKPIPNWYSTAYESLYKEKGHLNICLQLLRVLYKLRGKYEYVAFLEHDIMYAPNYFTRILSSIEAYPNANWLLNFDYIGMNQEGYQLAEIDRCMSQSVMKYEFAIKNLNRALHDCIMQGYCYLEPNEHYQVMIQDMECPNVHINMNGTRQSHHLTNHYSLYKPADRTNHPLWGDYKKYNIF